jgi:hypothetical protein
VDVSFRQRIREALGVSADVAGLVALAWIGIPAVVAVLGGPTAALAVALALSLFVIVVLLARLRKLNRDRRWLRRRLDILAFTSTRVIAVLDAIPEPEAEPAVTIPTGSPADPQSPWMTNPADPRTLTVTVADFERWMDKALELTRPQVGAGAKAYFDEMLIGFFQDGKPLASLPWVVVLTTGPVSMKTGAVSFRGSLEANSVSVRTITDESATWREENVVAKPWTQDTGWSELIEASWLRMAPMKDDAAIFLTALPRHEAGNAGLWRVTYLVGGDPAKIFCLTGGKLKEV